MAGSPKNARGTSSLPDGARLTPGKRSASTRRPERDFATGPITQLIRVATVMVTAITAIVSLALYPRMPESIPTHFNFAGHADSYGPRSFIFVMIAVFVPMIGGLAWLSFSPRLFNYPLPVTEGNAQGLYRAGEQMLVWMNAACAMLFVSAVSSPFSELGNVLVFPAIFGLVAALVGGIVKMFRQ